jgi:hypothetical protein
LKLYSAEYDRFKNMKVSFPAERLKGVCSSLGLPLAHRESTLAWSLEWQSRPDKTCMLPAGRLTIYRVPSGLCSGATAALYAPARSYSTNGFIKQVSKTQVRVSYLHEPVISKLILES